MQFQFEREYHLVVNDKKISVIEWGEPDAEPVICMHGWLDNAATFHYLAPYLDKKYRLIAFEMPGHGQSEHLSQDADYQFVSGISVIDSVLNTLNIESCQFIGHSMGGALGLLYAGAIPGRFTRMALIDSMGAITAPSEQAVEHLEEAIIQRRKKTSNKRFFNDLEIAAKARAQVSELNWKILYPLIERGVMLTDKGYQWSSDARLKRMSWLRMTENQHSAIIAKVEADVLLLKANNGILNQFPIGSRTAQIKNFEQINCEGGHHFHMQYPKETAEKILEFLK
ncbi:alpha/beta fold hydrolase [Kangiella sp. HZ709]|uniref:alpha/beta fold hydrolase n=1 Tax=Kangiella sp. HZ709 TaxID=2666328 RepID=UPI0012B0B15E|nr:alpha/beta hydrolase [Kangiella sp. HZ709]MRX26803.1 alpha/beta fold hydrolase [Kangiella sp. HZ709]